MDRLRRLGEAAESEYLAEPGVHDLAARYLHLAAEAAIDPANHWIADRGLRTPGHLSLPESLHRQIRILAKREGVSINQLLATAAAEKVAALMTEGYLEERARRGSHKKFRAVLKKVPDSVSRPRTRSDLRRR